jgi:glycosidase
MHGNLLFNEERTSTLWFRDAIVYQILVDRFAGYDEGKNWKKPIYMGGNIRGIIDRLPYLVSLGINTIWLSPVFRNEHYHGYHITDYYDTDKHFGTTADLTELIQNAHQKNIRVLLDFVPNHCSHKHPFFIKAIKDKKSPYRKWFYFQPFSNEYLCFLDFKNLPKLNLDYLPARDHIMGAAKYWLSYGIDGFRLDHVIGPSHDFWKHFNAEIKKSNPSAVLIGEAWLDGMKRKLLKTIHVRNKYWKWMTGFKTGIQHEYTGVIDGTLDFFFRYRITENIAWKDNPDDYLETLQLQMTSHYSDFPENHYLPSFIENHDMNRFLFDAGQNPEKLKLALKFQFSLPQPPILYYGTETGLTHHSPVSHDVPYSDLQARRPMPWNHLNDELIDYCRELIIQRQRR